MALDDLQGIIKKLQDRITMDHDYLSKHETRTRQVLIDPLLRELGWDVSDPAAVQLEYRVGQQWADYALMSDSQPVAVIEAKRLGRGLEDDEIMQVLNYANRDGIGYMIVTDGDHWEMYEVFKRGTLEERILMKIQLSQQLPHKNVLQVLGMWKPNLVSDEGDKPQPRPVPPDPPKDQWYSLVSERRYPQFTIPMQLKIGADIDRRVNTWKDVIHAVIAWLVDKDILKDNHCPIEIRGKTFIGCEAVNRDGTPFKDPRQLPKGLILQRRISTPLGQWEGFRALLDQLRVDTSAIRVSHKPDVSAKQK